MLFEFFLWHLLSYRARMMFFKFLLLHVSTRERVGASSIISATRAFYQHFCYMLILFVCNKTPPKTIKSYQGSVGSTREHVGATEHTNLCKASI